MKRHRLILIVSLLLNAALLLTLLYREGRHRIERFQLESDATSTAMYAGAMQAIADFGNGVKRLYRPTLAASPNDRAQFTGERESGAEVWSWVYFGNLGDSSRLTADAFTKGYNNRMRNFLADPASYERNGAAATRPAD